MKKITVVLIALMLVFAFAACGGGESSDPNLGTYTLTSAEMLGITVTPEEMYTGESYIELNGGGECAVTLDGETAYGEWTLEGVDITITIEDMASYGTLENGVIVIDLLEMGVNFTFEKQ